MEHAWELVEAVIRAEAHNSESEEWALLMSHLGWQKQQLARETMALLMQSNYDAKNQQLRALCWRLYTGTGSDSCKYLYTIVNPYAETGGCPQLLPEASDFDTILSFSGIPERMYATWHLFSSKLTMLPKPEVLHRPRAIIESKWRSSGPLSQQRSAVAAAYLIADVETNSANLEFCWIG